MSDGDNNAAIERGMANQFVLRQGLMDKGAVRVGWKAAFGGTQSMERFGVPGPLAGFLTDQTSVSDGAEIIISDHTAPVVEPEVAIHLGADVPAGATLEQAKAAIRGLGPAFELVDVSFPIDDVEKVLSHNIFHNGLILGDCDTSFAGGDVSGLSAKVTRNGETEAETTDVEAITGSLVETVQRFASFLVFFGGSLKQGDVIIGGSIIPPLWIKEPEDIVYELSPIGRIQVKYV